VTVTRNKKMSLLFRKFAASLPPNLVFGVCQEMGSLAAAMAVTATLASSSDFFSAYPVRKVPLFLLHSKTSLKLTLDVHAGSSILHPGSKVVC
jgi:hypothetical protein